MVPSGPARLLAAGLIAGAGAASAGTLAGCGHLARLRPGHPLGIVLMEYRLRPAEVLAASGRIVVRVTNDGRLVHSLVIARPTVTRPSPGGPMTSATNVLADSGDVAPGTSTSLTVTLPRGRYPLYSNVGQDQILGAVGTLTVSGGHP